MELKLTEEELSRLTKRELYEVAKQLKIRGRGKMRKAQLLEAVKRKLMIAKEMSGAESITSKVIRQEILEVEKTKTFSLPQTYETKFVGLIPVNPELLFTFWNLEGEKGEIELIVEGQELFRVPVELSWKKYYLKLPSDLSFKKVKVILRTSEVRIESEEVTLPSKKVIVEVSPKLGEVEELTKMFNSNFIVERKGYGD